MRGSAARQIIGEAFENNISFLDDDYNNVPRFSATQVQINFENSFVVIEMSEYKELQRQLQDFF